MISDNSAPDNAKVIAHPALKPRRVSPSSDSISFKYPFKRASAAVEVNGASSMPPPEKQLDETDNPSLNQSIVAEPLPYNVLFPEHDRSSLVGFV